MSASRDSFKMMAAGLLIGIGLGLLILAVVGIGGGFFSNLGKASAGDGVIAVPEVNAPAPDFELQSLEGENIQLSDFRGHPVVINFWATWCGPCRLEMPLIQKYYDRYSPDLVVLAINNDEPRGDVQNFVDELGLTFEVLLDPGTKVEDVYRIRAFPTTFFINADGVIRYQHIGILNEQQLVQYLSQVGVGE